MKTDADNDTFYVLQNSGSGKLLGSDGEWTESMQDALRFISPEEACRTAVTYADTCSSIHLCQVTSAGGTIAIGVTEVIAAPTASLAGRG